jgi:hypothetical protein
MSRHILSLSHEQLTPFGLEAFVTHANTLNQRHHETFTTPFPKAPRRWLSHYHFTPRLLTLTPDGDVEGGLSGLVGATIDFSFTRAICAPNYGTRGGPCYDPASLVVLEVAAKVDRYPDYASFCGDLHQHDKGRRYQELAGLHGAIPGEDDLSNFRHRVGAEAIEVTMAAVVELCRTFGLITDDLLSTDGQLEPSYSRFKGCTYACQDCQQLRLDEASQQELRRQLQRGTTRLQLTCPFPEVVQKVRQASRAKTGTPKDPKVALLQIEVVSKDQASHPDRQKVAALLALPPDQVPDLHLTWCRLRRNPQGELLASCPKVPSDLEAKVGYHIDTKDPARKERVFGYLHQKTTAINQELGLELPLGNSTYPANADEGTHFVAHRSALPLPMRPGQVHLGDAAYDVTPNYQWIRQQGGSPVFDYNPRRENLSAEALLVRGYDQHGTPYAPCGRLCRSNGYDQEVIANGRPPRMRGLNAFRFARGIRALAQLLRRALHFVLDVTYTLGKLQPLQT